MANLVSSSPGLMPSHIDEIPDAGYWRLFLWEHLILNVIIIIIIIIIKNFYIIIHIYIHTYIHTYPDTLRHTSYESYDDKCYVLFLLCNKLYVQYCVVFFIAH